MDHVCSSLQIQCKYQQCCRPVQSRCAEGGVERRRIISRRVDGEKPLQEVSLFSHRRCYVIAPTYYIGYRQYPRVSSNTYTSKQQHITPVPSVPSLRLPPRQPDITTIRQATTARGSRTRRKTGSQPRRPCPRRNPLPPSHPALAVAVHHQGMTYR